MSKTFNLLSLSFALSLASIACADRGASNTAAVDESAVTAAAPALDLTQDGRSATSALLGVSRMLFDAPQSESARALSKFAETTLTNAHVANLPNGDRRYLFNGLILNGGDIVEGSMQLVILEKRTIGFEAPPTYSAAISTTEKDPAAGGGAVATQMLTRNDVRLAHAVLSLAGGVSSNPQSENTTQLKALVTTQEIVLEKATIQTRPDSSSLFTLYGLILVGGDAVIGSARMTIDEKLVPAPIGFGTTSLYTAKTTISE